MCFERCVRRLVTHIRKYSDRSKINLKQRKQRTNHGSINTVGYTVLSIRRRARSIIIVQLSVNKCRYCKQRSDSVLISSSSHRFLGLTGYRLISTEAQLSAPLTSLSVWEARWVPHRQHQQPLTALRLLRCLVSRLDFISAQFRLLTTPYSAGVARQPVTNLL